MKTLLKKLGVYNDEKNITLETWMNNFLLIEIEKMI